MTETNIWFQRRTHRFGNSQQGDWRLTLDHFVCKSLYPGFSENEPPSSILDSNIRKTAYEGFGTKIRVKLDDVKENEPFIGFVSPVFLSPRIKDTPTLAYEIYGINPITRKYEKLSSWTPSDTDTEGSGSQSFRYTDISDIEDPDGNLSLRGIVFPSRTSRTMRLYTNSYFRARIDHAIPGEGGESVVRDLVARASKYPATGTRYENSSDPMVSVFNYTERVEENIQNSTTSATGRRRLPAYVGSINREVLKILDDKCVTQDDQNKALSIVTAIQARMQRFFINTLPLARVYLNWNSLATSNLIINYLTPMIINDLQEKGLLGLIYQFPGS